MTMVNGDCVHLRQHLEKIVTLCPQGNALKSMLFHTYPFLSSFSNSGPLSMLSHSLTNLLSPKLISTSISDQFNQNFQQSAGPLFGAKLSAQCWHLIVRLEFNSNSCGVHCAIPKERNFSAPKALLEDQWPMMTRVSQNNFFVEFCNVLWTIAAIWWINAPQKVPNL